MAKVTKKLAATRPKAAASAPAVSDEAVTKATGHGWNHWFTLLDKAGAKDMKHADIARLLHDKHAVPAWWSQGVTVAYERARGLREKGQTSSGYQTSASKTINASAERVFEAWNDAKLRRRWLDEEVTIRKATPAKSLRITWSDGQTSVEVWLTAKSPEKTGLSVQHTKIQEKARVDQLKSFWAERLEALKGLLEG